MEPTANSDEEDTIRYAGYTAVMLAPERGAINHVDYAQLGDDDNDIQAVPINPDANGNHINGGDLEGFSDDDEEVQAPPPSKPPAAAAGEAPRGALSRDAPMEAARVSEVLEAMAGIQLRAPPPAWLMGSDWQAPLRGRVPLKASAAAQPAPPPAVLAAAPPSAPPSTPVAASAAVSATTEPTPQPK